MRADLHMHSIHSDGTLTVFKLLKRATTKNLDVISLTDHDSVNGVEKALEYGKKFGIKVIPGIELSTYRNGESVHILGYFNNHIPKELYDYAKKIRLQRRGRIIKMAKNCERLHGLKVDYKRLLKPVGIITRAHLIREIALSNPIYTTKEVANNFLLEHCPAFIPSSNLDTADGIKMLKELNALVVLAHPVLLEDNDVEDIIKLGVDGIEGIYPKNKDGDEERFRELCKKYNLFITAGSDYHGIIDYSHGDMADNVLLDGEVEEFLRRLGEKSEN